MLIIGHRGDMDNFPENSIEGISSALEKGTDGVEFDVFYKPGIGVYLQHSFDHDPLQPYPRLTDVFERFSGKGILVIEIKQPETEAVDAVAELIRKYEVPDFEITSCVLPLLSYVHEVLPEARIGMNVRPHLLEKLMTKGLRIYFLINYLKLTGAENIWLSRPRNFWDKDTVSQFHNSGFRVCSQLLTGNKEEFERMLSMGIDACTADNLNVLQWRDNE